VKIRGKKLGELAAKAGLSLEDMAQGMAEPSFPADRAAAAISNWLRGSDHPRCDKKKIERLAGLLRVQPKEIARFTSKVNHHRGSPRKARLIADLIRGKRVEEAMNLLQFSPKRAAVNVKRCLTAARDEAIRQDADINRLVVVESTVDEGPRMKRFNQKDRGRAHAIIKCFSHITIGLEEK
jgi:large subunit ribosomal protein L22